MLEKQNSESNLAQMYAIGVIMFILSLSSLMEVPVLPELSRELGAGATAIPLVVSAALTTVVLAQFFTGILADRYSKRMLILGGSLVGSISSLLCVVASHWSHLAILRVIGGLADAVTMPVLLTTTAKLGKEHPGKFFGILRESQGLSYAIGPLFGSVFSLVSLRAPFIIDGLLSLLAFCAIFFLFGDTTKTKTDHSLKVFRGIRSTVADRRVYLCLLMGISGLFGYGILYSFIPTKAALLGLKAWQIGVIMGGGATAFSIVSYVIGTLSDRFGRYRFVIASQLLIIISGIGLMISNGFVMLSVFYAIFCVGESTTFLLSFVYATHLFDSRYMGTSMGVFDSLMDLSLFIAPGLAILLYKTSGAISPVFILVVLPAVLAFFAMIKWLPAEHKLTNGPLQSKIQQSN
jgi:ACDE family multidrug resistance protein